MTVGILTFHSQLNYGGVLQSIASYVHLKKQGYDAVVVDRWFTADNDALLGYFAARSIKGWFKLFIKLAIRTLFSGGYFRHMVRIWRTCSFLKKNIKRTKYHFTAWEQVETDRLGFDVLYVGSDQVWSCTWNSPAVYLLEGLSIAIPAVSYAASFGIQVIPNNLTDLYRRGLNRFKAISVREKNGKELISGLGVKIPVKHVVDPVLLLERSDWQDICKVKQEDGDFVFCYILRENMFDVLPVIIELSNKYRINVKVYVGGPFLPILKHNPVRGLLRNWRLIMRMLLSRVSVKSASGPREFVRDIAASKGVVSDSFHAMMFSVIFNKNVRIIRPQDELARKMFSRMDEFAERYVEGHVFLETVEAALEDLIVSSRNICYKYEQLNKWRADSRNWLKRSLQNCQEGPTAHSQL